MARELCLSVIVEIPDDDLFQSSSVIAKLQPAWNGLLLSLAEAKLQHTYTSEIMEVRTKRGRPRKAQGVINLVPPEPEAA